MIARRVTCIAAAVALSLSVAACSSSTAESQTTSAPASSASPSASPSAIASVFPVTIAHAYGETTIPAKPERVAAVAWSNHEIPLALGIVPVGMSKVTWGDDDNDGVLPWVEEALAALGASTPVLFDETDGINFEAVADTDPDVILAPYSGLSKEDYDTLSKIAPVVAFPEVAWGATWEQMLDMGSTALGLAPEGVALEVEIQAKVQAALDAHPELKDKKVLFAYIDPKDLSQIGFYNSYDTRPSFLANLGMPTPAIVEEMSTGDKADTYRTVSAEEADRFDDVDLFVTVGEADSDFIAQLQADPLLSKIPAIKSGAVAILENSTPLAASAGPSPLSIGWAVDDYFALLAGALKSNG